MYTRELFDEIRPFEDYEINDAIGRLIRNPEFALFVRYLFKGVDRNEVFNSIKDISSIAEFQDKFVRAVLDVVISRSVDSLNVQGIEHLAPKNAYLFISNHRDIVLDSAFINLLLLNNGYNTAQIAIGGNLLISPMITDLVRINKSFIVKRNIPPRELYKYSRILSSYISYALTERNESVWIAQREGRSKDGNDKTQTSLLKMIIMNNEDNFIEAFAGMNLAPVAISYEYDPCDVMKAVELYSISNNLPYEKTQETDFNSINTGLHGYKGRVEVSFCDPFTLDDYKSLGGIHLNDWLKSLAVRIDEKIYQAYRLWDTSYIAFDMLSGEDTFISRYSLSSKNKFTEYLHEKTAGLEPVYPGEAIRHLVMNMYANPLKNKLIHHFSV